MMHDDNVFLLFYHKVEVWIPNDFHENSEQIEKKYPFKSRPSIIKVDCTGKVFITFDLYAKPLSSSQLASAAVSIKKLVRQVYPYNDKIILKRFKSNHGLAGIGLSFYTMMCYGRQFTELFVFSIHGQLFIGTVTCPEESKVEWSSVFWKVKKGVQEIEQNNNREVSI